MNKPVTLKELVATKIIFALMIASYYWMWARTDWKDYYQTIQNSIAIFFGIFFIMHADRIRKYKKESFDEMAEQNLRRCDSICLKILVVVSVAAAWMSTIFAHVNGWNGSIIGWVLVLALVVISIIRTILFWVMDSKGV